MLSSFVLSQIVIRTSGRYLGVSDVPPPNAISTLNPFRIRTSEKWAHNSFTIRTSKLIGLKVLWNPHVQKREGGGGKLLTRFLGSRPLATTRFRGFRRGSVCASLRPHPGSPQVAALIPRCHNWSSGQNFSAPKTSHSITSRQSPFFLGGSEPWQCAIAGSKSGSPARVAR